MAAATQTLASTPASRRTLGWIRDNLFGSALDAGLTGLVLAALVLVANPFFTWVTETAEWPVIRANLTLMAKGRYPIEFVWRIWIVVGMCGLLAGLLFSIFGSWRSRPSLVTTVLPLALMAVPIISNEARMALAAVFLAVVAGQVAGVFGPERAMQRAVLWYLVLLWPLAIVVLRGFGDTGPFQLVPTRHWGGLLLSVLLSASGIIISYPLGILLALGRRSSLPILKTLCVIYIEFIRGVPLISLLFMSVTMLQLFLPAGFPQIEGIIRVGVAITLFSAAYVAENVRGGLQSIPAGQYEATWALGLNKAKAMTFVILPQALKAVIPVTIGQFISLFKDTTLVALVGITDLFGIGRAVLGNPDWLGKHREVFFFIGAVFWVMNYTLSYGSRKLEQALNTDNPGRD